MTKSVTILLALLLASVTAQAQGYSESSEDLYEIRNPGTPILGLFTGTTSGGDLDENGQVWGAHISVVTASWLFLDVSVATLEDSTSVSMSDGGVQFSTKSGYDIIDLGLGGYVQLPLGRLRLYGGGGVDFLAFDESDGVVTVDHSSSPHNPSDLTVDSKSDVEGTWGYHIAFGAAYQLNRHTELFAEYRYLVAERTMRIDSTVTANETRSVTIEETVTETEVETTYGDTAFLDGGYEFGMLTVGLNIYF